MTRLKILKSLFRPRWLLIVAALALVGFATFLFYLDRQVRSQFEGKRFALPARVYARPLELFAGARVSAEEFSRELAQLGYLPRLDGAEAGRFERRGGEFDLVTRPFTFWDGSQGSQSLHLSFRANRLERLTTGEGDGVTLARLDPVYIGGIYPEHNEDRILVKLEEVPESLVHALIAIEDRTFFSHIGIDPRGMARAVVSTLSGSGVQGGSTLTQQLVKNFYLTSERTLQRKLTEVVMALLLELHYDKREILETYINEIYLGQDKNRAIHGFGLAAQFYFGKRIDQLELHEAALLVGMVKGPSYYDPHRRPQRALERRNTTLAVMRGEHYISEEQYLAAKAKPLGVVAKPSMGTTPYPAFLALVRRQLLHDYREADLRSEGLQIFTTLDPHVQVAAERSLIDHLRRFDNAAKGGRGSARAHAGLEGAVVVTDSQTGEVQALVGGRDPRYEGFNRVLDSRRPVGSLMKPAVYLAALSDPARYTLTTSLLDEPFVWHEKGRPDWTPANYDRVNHGQVTLRTALVNSYNIPAARLGLELGVASILDKVSRIIGRKLPAHAAGLLGAVELSPFEVAQLYQTFASGGFRVPLQAIREVLTAEGKPLQRYELSVEQVVEPAPAYLLTHALQGVVREGTGQGLKAFLPPGVDAAGKTGTTDDLRDSWFAGFTGDRVAVVWVGYDDNDPTTLSGATGAMNVWGGIMAQLEVEPLAPAPPENVEMAWVDRASGLKSDPSCQGAVEVPFIRGSAPNLTTPCARAAHGPLYNPLERWVE